MQTYNEAGMVSYAYNAAGLRVGKTVGGVETVFVLDGGNVALELESGTVTAKYLWAMNLVCAVRGMNTRYYLYNGHGDVMQLTDSSGAVTQSYAYDAFGVEADPDDNDTNPFRYCGEYYDTETGKYYLRARYYDPGIGRFSSEDPIGAGLNWYTYCSGNPISFIDPSGQDPIPQWAKNINSGQGTAEDFQQALEVYLNDTASAWAGSAGIAVSNAIDLTLSYFNFYVEVAAGGVTKDTPPTENDGYIAPRGGPVQGKDQSGNKGWVDKYGNIWVPVPDGTRDAHGGGHWDVERPDGKGYVNKYPGGREREGSGKRPNLPTPSQASNSSIDWETIGIVALVVAVVAAAIAAAPATGGTSLGLLALV